MGNNLLAIDFGGFLPPASANTTGIIVGCVVGLLGGVALVFAIRTYKRNQKAKKEADVEATRNSTLFSPKPGPNTVYNKRFVFDIPKNGFLCFANIKFTLTTLTLRVNMKQKTDQVQESFKTFTLKPREAQTFFKTSIVSIPMLELTIFLTIC